jgi:8-oxo-dGTP pyrophosphatase MutT (NUDIX family)
MICMDDRLDMLRHRLQVKPPRRASARGRIEAAVSLLLAPGNSGGLDLLLIKRTEFPRDPWSGQMALPGGRRDPADYSLAETATRETREETGIVVPPDRLVGELDDLSPQTPHLPPIVVRPFVFALSNRPRPLPNAEVALAFWVPLHTFPAARVRESIQVGGHPLTVDGFRFGPHLVWGMTERILASLLQRMESDSTGWG